MSQAEQELITQVTKTTLKKKSRPSVVFLHISLFEKAIYCSTLLLNNKPLHSHMVKSILTKIDQAMT